MRVVAVMFWSLHMGSAASLDDHTLVLGLRPSTCFPPHVSIAMCLAPCAPPHVSPICVPPHMSHPMSAPPGCSSPMCVQCAPAGNGANMAFCDAWQLAQQLMDPSHATLDEAVIAFDAEAGPRSTQALSRGTHLMSLCHQQGIRHWLIRGLICIVRVIMGASSFGDTVKLWRFLGRLFGAHKNAEKL